MRAKASFTRKSLDTGDARKIALSFVRRWARFLGFVTPPVDMCLLLARIQVELLLVLRRRLADGGEPTRSLSALARNAVQLSRQLRVTHRMILESAGPNLRRRPRADFDTLLDQVARRQARANRRAEVACESGGD